MLASTHRTPAAAPVPPMIRFSGPLLPLAFSSLCLPIACPAGPAPPPFHRVAPAAGWVTRANNEATLRVRLPAAYQPRNGGCWTARKEVWHRPGWRDLCVSLQPGPVEGMRGWLEWGQSDAYCVEGFREERMPIGGRTAIVERARVSGGIGGQRDVRTIHVRIQLNPREWMVMQGGTGDDAGYDELLAIAGTLTPADAPAGGSHP